MKPIGNEIINPALMLAISRMKENNNMITQNKMVEEVLKAKFLVPCTMQFKEGTEKEKVRTTVNTFPAINMIKTTEGQLYFMGFTDLGELKKWQDKNGQNMLVLGFDDIAGLARNPKSNAEGFVINPATSNVVFRNSVIEMIMKNRDQANGESKVQVSLDESSPKSYEDADNTVDGQVTDGE